jgi:hypothetical protein
MVPEITNLQILVLEALLRGEQTGRGVRVVLAEHGVRKSAPAFYQLMARLEDGGLIEGRYESKVVDGQPIKERRYRLTGVGERTWESAVDFYRERARAAGRRRPGLAGA